jgi:hypothetical protein
VKASPRKWVAGSQSGTDDAVRAGLVRVFVPPVAQFHGLVDELSCDRADAGGAAPWVEGNGLGLAFEGQGEGLDLIRLEREAIEVQNWWTRNHVPFDTHSCSTSEYKAFLG